MHWYINQDFDWYVHRCMHISVDVSIDIWMDISIDISMVYHCYISRYMPQYTIGCVNGYISEHDHISVHFHWGINGHTHEYMHMSVHTSIEYSMVISIHISMSISIGMLITECTYQWMYPSIKDIFIDISMVYYCYISKSIPRHPIGWVNGHISEHTQVSGNISISISLDTVTDMCNFQCIH